MDPDEMTDFHLVDLQKRILLQDQKVKIEGFSIDESNFLKLFKWNILKNSLLSFNPSVYTLVQKIDNSIVKILLMTYNEEVLEDIIFQVEDGKFIDDSLVNHICSSLNRKYKICLGIENTPDITNYETIEKILIEKYGDNIFYRSRNCSRIVLDDDSTECFECRQLQPESLNIKSETFENNMDSDAFSNFEDAESKDYDEDFEVKKEVKVKVKREKSKKSCSNETTSFSCMEDGCDITFLKEPTYVSHLLKSHPHQSYDIIKTWHKCPENECFKVFKDLMGKNMINHLQKFHEDNPDVKAEKEKNNDCSYCGKSFSHSHYLKKHIENAHEAPVIPCHICGTFIKGHKTLNVHIRVVHGNTRFKCPEPGCNVEAKNKDHIKDHIAAIHRNEPRYICSVCGTRYKYRNKWKYCEDKHKGKFLHECKQCDRKFNDKRKFQIHQRVHTGEKPFMCPICSIRMARLDNLNAHTKKTHGVTWREAEKMTQNTINGEPVFNSDVKPITEKITQDSIHAESVFTSNQMNRESVFSSEIKPVFSEPPPMNQSADASLFASEMKPVFSDKPLPLNTMAT